MGLSYCLMYKAEVTIMFSYSGSGGVPEFKEVREVLKSIANYTTAGLYATNDAASSIVSPS